MHITKYGHSCILLDDGKAKILFDPGVYSHVPDISVDGIIITHVHPDHLHSDTLLKLLQQQSAPIVTNTEVATELNKLNIQPRIVEEGANTTVKDFSISAFGNEHAIIHPEIPKFQNTGYMINELVYHPGDALFVPTQLINVLLLPIIAPWSKISETLDYITAVKPKVVFPIHDGFLGDTSVFYGLVKKWCDQLQIEFIEPELNKPYAI